MPDIASVNGGEPATLTDLCDLIECGSEEERMRFIGIILDPPLPKGEHTIPVPTVAQALRAAKEEETS